VKKRAPKKERLVEHTPETSGAATESTESWAMPSSASASGYEHEGSDGETAASDGDHES
jgi:hypothetical protein